MKDKIICLVGPSGSGKTTIAKELEKEGFNVIQSYTTRPPREPNEWGHTFLDGNPAYIPYVKNRIAHQELYGYHYWATKDQYQGKGTSIYIIDPAGAKQVKENVKDAEVVTIFLAVDREDRIRRLRRRFLDENNITMDSFFDSKLQSEMRGYIRERINRDVELFSLVRCDYVVDANRELQEVLNDIKQII